MTITVAMLGGRMRQVMISMRGHRSYKNATHTLAYQFKQPFRVLSIDLPYGNVIVSSVRVDHREQLMTDVPALVLSSYSSPPLTEVTTACDFSVTVRRAGFWVRNKKRLTIRRARDGVRTKLVTVRAQNQATRTERPQVLVHALVFQ